MKGYRLLWLALLVAPLAFGQGIYKWVDAKGQVHYGEEPPEGGAAAQVTVKTAPPSGEGAAPQQDRSEATRKLLRTFEEEHTQKEEAEAKAAKEAEKRKRNCMVARDQLRRYQNAGAIYDLDKNGERRIYSDDERAATLKRAEADVAKYCK